MNQPPDPNGPQPDDWHSLRWLAYCGFAAGGTYRQVALEVDRSPGTVGTWVREWRQSWPDLFADQAAANREASRSNPPRTTDQSAARSSATQTADWASVRTSVGAATAADAQKLVDAASGLLDDLMGDPERRAQATANDVLRLARASALLFATAEALTADRGHRITDDQRRRIVDANLLAGLESSSEVQSTTSKLVVLMDEYRESKDK